MKRKNKIAVLASVDKMLWQLAWTSWRTLPKQIKLWIDPEDLYQETRLHTYKILDQWNPSKGAQTTFIQTSVRNRLINVVEGLKARKRYRAEIEWTTLKNVDREKIVFLDPIIDAVILIMFGRY